MKEADQSLVELVRLWIIEVPHQVGDSVHLVCYQETGDGHLEVLKGSLSGEHGSEGV
jgi:ribosomal protein L35AE/L33A